MAKQSATTNGPTTDQEKTAETIGTIPQMWARIRRAEAESLRAQLRLQYQPLVAAGAVAALGLIQQLATALGTGQIIGAAATGLAITTTLALLGRTVRSGWWAEAAAWVRAHPVRAVLIGAASWVWLIAAALAGWDGWQELATGGLWAWVALSAHWWRTHRIGYTPLPPATPTTAAPNDLGAHYATLWEENLGTQSGVFKGTTLTNHRATTYGHAWDVRIRPGSKGLEAMRSDMTSISTALGVARKLLSLEQGSDDDPLVAELRVTTHPPTAEPVPIVNTPNGPTVFGHPVYDPDTGDITLGPYADGQGVHTWGLYRTNSLLGGYAFGAQKSGKSELLNLLALGMRLSGATTYWYVDGQEGTQPTLQDTADWDASATAAKRRLSLEAAVITVHLRQKTNQARRAKGFTPTPQRPGLVLILDESHITIKTDYVRDPEDTVGFGAWSNADLVDCITRVGRKCGVAIIAASQDTGMGAFGGEGNPGRTIRGNLFSANVALMHSQDAIAGSIAPKAAMSVTELPKGGGYGVAANEVGEDGGVQTRAVMWRAAFRDDAAPEGGITDLIHAAGPALSLEPEAAQAIDHLLEGAYTRRNEVSAEERAEALAESVHRFLAGDITVADLLFDGESAAAAKPSSGRRLPGLLDLSDYADAFVPVPPFLAEALAVFERANDTRMHTERLAEQMGLSDEALRQKMLDHGVRALKNAFSRGGREARGYDVRDVKSAAERHQNDHLSTAS